MKVKIGKYPTRFISNFNEKISALRHKKEYYKIHEEEFDKFDNFLESIANILQIIYNKTINKYLDKNKRSVKIKINDEDLWDCCDTLGYIILPMLKKIKEKRQGAPYISNDDVPDEYKAQDSYEEKDCYDDWFKRWNYVLDEMIFAFESVVDESWEDQFHSGEIDFVSEKIIDESTKHKVYYKLTEGPNNTHVFDQDGYEKYNQRIENGMMLFGKYFRSLYI